MYHPKRLVPALTAILVALAACDRSPTAADPSARPESPMFATNTSAVCMSTSVPSGYVILSYGNLYNCPPNGPFYNYNNAMTIGLPGSPETVCKNSPIPSGYVLTSYPGMSYSCDQYGTGTTSTHDNKMTIKIPGASETVCSASPIPSNYDVVSSAWISACDDYNSGYSTWPNSKTIRRR